MTAKEFHTNTIIPLREQLRKAEEEYFKLYRKECAEKIGAKFANCDNCAYSCVLCIDDHNNCLGGKCTCCHSFCYNWIPETKVSAWLRENHKFGDDFIYRLEDMFGDDFLKCDDVDLILRALQLMNEVKEKAEVANK
ncbi:MAG: hypothetical protein UH850_12625 [Paludibacteraceae bacterium]|nr:hypothetical protein [Paludibacteraceae bacterium]